MRVQIRPRCWELAAPDGVDSAVREGGNTAAAHPGAATLWNCKGAAMVGTTLADNVPIAEWMEVRKMLVVQQPSFMMRESSLPFSFRAITPEAWRL